MDQRTLLMITYHFPPSAASGTFRMLGFARHLPTFGWRTTVIAPPRTPWEPVDPALRERVPASTTILETPFPEKAPKVLRWAAGDALWLPRAWSACRRALCETRPDAVLTTGPPHWVHTLGWYLKRWKGIPWVADFRDPWITGLIPPNWRNAWPRFWERRVMKHADRIVANAPQACALYQSAFPEYTAKMISLTNGFDPENFPPPKPRERSAGPLHIIHTGELYVGRNPAVFLDALQALARDGLPFRATFLGRTDSEGFNLTQEVQSRNLQALVQGGRQVPYAESLQEMANADILLLLDTPGRRIGVPAKLYEYLGTRRAILALAEDYGDTAHVLRESGVQYRLAPLKDSAAIQKALRELAVEVTGTPPPNDKLVRFTREHLAGELAHHLDAIVGHRQ